MAKFYTDEVNVQIVIQLLKEHGISRIVACPGGTNVTFIASIQDDPFFEIISSNDERSAAYIACGWSAEAGEPVAISCTGATASRNFYPGMTEAFYRKLPVLAITSTQVLSRVGHHIAQVIDRSVIPNDVAMISVALPVVENENDVWDCEIKANKAILELRRNGGGPAHINMPTTYSRSYECRKLPSVRVIKRYDGSQDFPVLPKGKIAVFVGAHLEMTKDLELALDAFCREYNGAVFFDSTSGYHGECGIKYALLGSQEKTDFPSLQPDLVVHIGEVTGDYYGLRDMGAPVWRVSEDGEIRDTFGRLVNIFEMDEKRFFRHYVNAKGSVSDGNLKYLRECRGKLAEVRAKIPELPFSNIWVASKLAEMMPRNSTIHFGILNSLRAWNFFDFPEGVRSACNVGGFGTDGALSTVLGASLADKTRPYYVALGDLAFFYDINALGNRHVGKNLRVLLINNGKGMEFRNRGAPASELGTFADKFISASGHYGRMSRELVRHFAQDLGFEYYSAENKTELLAAKDAFLNPKLGDKPLLLEVFTTTEDEVAALEMIRGLEVGIGSSAKTIIKSLVGEAGASALKRIVGK